MATRCSKLVVVGDGMVGKTALLSAYAKDSFQENYIPTVFDTTSKDVELVGDRRLTLGLWDTGGQEEFDQIRQLAYPGASIVLLCYAIDCPTSLENILHTWIGEVTSNCPGVPTMLVGCKSDHRISTTPSKSSSSSSRQKTSLLVDPKVAQEVSKQIGAYLHIECSAQTRSNVNTVFDLAAWIILEREEEEKRHKPSRIQRILSFNREKNILNGTVNRSCNSDLTYRRSRFKPILWCYGRQ